MIIDVEVKDRVTLFVHNVPLLEPAIVNAGRIDAVPYNGNESFRRQVVTIGNIEIVLFEEVKK